MSKNLPGRVRQRIVSFCTDSRNVARLHTIAWLLFLVCGVIYLAASVRDRDPLMIAGSVCFLLAVIIFLFPSNK
jgi:lipid-A-disaccharide synthase-like uncharacterized protein